jgi:predicted outer membrane repeat protein
VLACSVLAVSVQAQKACPMKPVSFTVSSQTEVSALQKVLDEAALCPSTTINAVWQGTVKLAKPVIVGNRTTLTLTGENVTTSIADGGRSTQLFVVNRKAALVLINMTLANGYTESANGGAIMLGDVASLKAIGSVFTNNAVRDDLPVKTGAPTPASFSSFTPAPVADTSVYVPAETPAPTSGENPVQDPPVADAPVVGFGGAVYGGLNSTININNSSFVNNTASMAGGAVGTQAGVIITNSVFDSNSACVANAQDCFGGGAVAFTANAIIRGSKFSYNSATNSTSDSSGDGGCLLDLSIASIRAEDYSSSSSAYNSAVLDDGFESAVLGVIKMESSNFTNNSADRYAGAVYVQGDVSMTKCRFLGNTAVGDGGAQSLYQGNISIGQCVFAENTVIGSNTTSGSSGAVFLGDDLRNVGHSIHSSTFINNSCAGSGGAVYSGVGRNRGGLIIIASTFTSNTAANNGGSIEQSEASSFLLVDSSSFTSNKAMFGGSIQTAGSTELTAVVLTSNRASSGGAVRATNYLSLGDVTMKSNAATLQGNT